MADFRKCIPVLAVLALILGSAVTANAQPNAAVSCIANAGVPPLVRAEGLTEKVGDLILNCNGGTPTPAGFPIPKVNVQIFLNTSVTSRLTGSGSEALLLIDEPGSGVAGAPATQLLCPAPGSCAVTGTGIGGGTPFTGETGRPNVFQGSQAATNSIVFFGVPFDPPGTNATRVIRITNVRANANAFGVAAGNNIPAQITEVVTASGATSLPINNPTQAVGFVQKGLTVSLRSNVGGVPGDPLTGAVALQQCFDINTNSARTTPSQGFAGGTNFFVRFQEGFATAFKRRTIAAYAGSEASPAPASQNIPGAIFDTESGFNGVPGIPAAGLADFGTRVKIVFNNVPAGTLVFVPAAVPIPVISATGTTNATQLRLVSSETGAFAPLGTVGTPQQITLTTTGAVSSGAAIYEVLSTNPFSLETVDIPVNLSFTANPGSNLPGLGTGQVSGSFAPTSTNTAATDSSAPIPRFADTSTATSAFQINPCVTNLLFPFVTNMAGFDTGLAISNTSADPFGTAPQNGTCTLNFYGANAPAALTSPVVTAGTVYATLASTSAPNFQGYVIAQCRFQFGHGFAFISDLGAQRLAEGYLALVIPDPARRTTNAIFLNNGTGELLGQ